VRVVLRPAAARDIFVLAEPVATKGRGVRRLAQQSRDGVYASMRDYQELHAAQGQTFHAADRADHRLNFTAQAAGSVNTSFVAAGLYVNPSKPVHLELTLAADGQQSTMNAHLGGGHWNRVGVAMEVASAAELRVNMYWSGAVDIGVWGLSAGPLELPKALLTSAVSVRGLSPDPPTD
jgi:hypothetical protein